MCSYDAVTAQTCFWHYDGRDADSIVAELWHRVDFWHPGLDGGWLRCCCYDIQESLVLCGVLMPLPANSSIDCAAWSSASFLTPV
ncbi:hypothetical protein HPB52_002279 [Rhipicephalus sanguineus]|uniref:Uncharacterized protein n=1 Tax=Rhipicephalus sanguineus TaxID=34632 RepID=A0A9D4PTW6_RHISA|nr:hypothetical protein HPB52_002279 [Rhipicephalus sanguineus]